MKVTAFNGSARRKGNTHLLLETALAELEAAGIETEQVAINGRPFRGCTDCRQCFKRKDGQCGIKDDFVADCIERMKASDGIILASPTYFADVSAEMKALIDRAGRVARVNGELFRRKVGASVVAARRAGSIHAFDTMNHFFQVGQMVIVGSSYWNVGVGLDKGGVATDEEGLATMRTLGQNMAWLLGKLHA